VALEIQVKTRKPHWLWLW